VGTPNCAILYHRWTIRARAVSVARNRALGLDLCYECCGLVVCLHLASAVRRTGTNRCGKPSCVVSLIGWPRVQPWIDRRFSRTRLSADILDRKPTTWLYYLGALLISLCLFLLVRDHHTFLAMSAASGFFSSGQFAWMTIYLSELFPTRVRGTAMSPVFDSSRSVSALGPLLAGRLVSSFGGLGTAAAVMSLIYVLGLMVTPFAGPETKGKPLPV
jgi:hypothetical protein